MRAASDGISLQTCINFFAYHYITNCEALNRATNEIGFDRGLRSWASEIIFSSEYSGIQT